jgi:hypothetical protein
MKSLEGISHDSDIDFIFRYGWWIKVTSLKDLLYGLFDELA